MTDFKARPDEVLNPYAPPRTDPPSPAESVIRDYRGRAGAIRIIAMLHFFFALCLIPAVIGPIVGGIDTWKRSKIHSFAAKLVRVLRRLSERTRRCRPRETLIDLILVRLQ